MMVPPFMETSKCWPGPEWLQPSLMASLGDQKGLVHLLEDWTFSFRWTDIMLTMLGDVSFLYET